MEAFSLLKYWKGGGNTISTTGGFATGEVSSSSTTRSSSSTTATILTAVSNPDVETDDEEGDCDDDGPFFDLEFSVPDEDVEAAEGEGEEEKFANGENAGREVVEVMQEEENDDVDGGELKFALSSGSSSGDRAEEIDLSLSPSDDLFFKGRLVPVEPLSSEAMNSKASSQLAVSLLKSATKLRVLMSGLKKSKPQQPQQHRKQPPPPNQPQESKENHNNNGSKFFTVKFKIEEVPLVSLFTRDNSSRTSNAEETSNKQPSQQNQSAEEDSAGSAPSKDVMQKYLKKVKPLYIRVSKRYGDKLKLSGQLSFNSQPKAAFALTGESGELKEEPTVAFSGSGASGGDWRSQKQGNLGVGFKEMCKHLGKNKSASSVVHSVPVQSRRRDDSLLQQQDGIQSAILHCKRSFNGSREETESSVLLSRSASDQSPGKTTKGACQDDGNDAVEDGRKEDIPDPEP